MHTAFLNTNPTLAVVTMLLCLVGAPPSLALRNVRVGDPLPPFSVQIDNGGKLTNESFAGKVLLLILARPKQEKSLQVLGVAQRILNETSAAKLAVLAVSTKPGTDEYFTGVVSELGLTFPIAMDPGRKMYGDIGVIVTPTTILLDESGVIKFVLAHVPTSYDRKVRAHIDLMLGAITSEAHDSRLADKDESTGQKKDVRARRLGYAHALLEKREFEPALTVLRALHAEEETPAVALLIGATLLDLGRTEDAGKVLDPMLEQDVTSPRAMVTLARLEFARGKPTKAETLLQAALVHSPEKGQILFLMGQIYEDRADLVKAVDCYRRALEESYGLPRSPTSKASHNLGSDPAAGTSPGEKPGG